MMHILVKDDICLPEQRLFKRSEKVEDGEGILSVEDCSPEAAFLLVLSSSSQCSTETAARRQ